jgi:hypothetical protein
LNAVHVILHLRELTVADNWDEVKRYVNDEANWQNLPSTALEEIRACREGLLYQHHIVRIAHALCQGAILGLPHEIDYDQISCDELVVTLQACEEVRFTDPSALLIIELAQRIVHVRHLLLADQWLDDGAPVKPENGLSLETPSKLRKSIYSHPVLKKTTVERETVDTCVQDFLAFLATAVPKLQRLLRVSPLQEGSDGFEMSSFLREASLELAQLESTQHPPSRGGVNPTMNAGDWIVQIWHAVMHVALEINLAQQVIQYRTVLIQLIEAADTTPDMVRAYVLDRTHVHANVHPLLRSNHHHEDITLYGAGSASNLGSYAVGGNSSFDTGALETALQRAKEYLAHVGFETSEEMLKLQETCKLLIEFRSALNAQESHELLLQLLIRTKTQASKGFISSENGVFEINAYIASTAESVRIQNGLRAALRSHCVSGPLNALQLNAVQTSELQLVIDDALRFLGRGGAALSIGVPPLLLQARVIHKLRTALVDHAWSALEYTLRTYDAHAAEWDVAGAEFQHVMRAFQFRTVMIRIRAYVADFTGEDDLGHTLMCLDVDLTELNEIFAELNALLQYSSPLLHATASGVLSNPEDTIEAPEVVLTAEFYRHTGVVACAALWKLYRALQASAWFVKQAIHDNDDQQISDTPDPFLFAFFGVANASYVHNVYRGLGAEDITTSFQAPALTRQETVFSIMVATNWAVFPYNIRQLFNRVRNRLIDRFIRADLKYYCKKGATAMDGAGNLVLSSMNLQFLRITLGDAQRAVATARKHGIPFEWTPETQKWVSAAETALKYRQALMTSNSAADTVVELLRGDGMMRGHTQFIPRLFSIHTELEVLEKFGQAHLAEKVAVAALQFVASQPPQDEGHFSEMALENDAVLQLFELAAAPIPVAEPSAYLVDVLAIVSLTRDAIFATMLGGQARLASLLEDLQEAVSLHHSDQLQAVNMQHLVRFLTAACRKAYHAELLDFSSSQALTAPPRRNITRVATVLGTRATARYLGSAAVQSTPPKAAAGRSVRPAPTFGVLDDELVGVAKLAAFTQKIVTALCELLYFHQGDEHITMGTKEMLIDQLRRKVPTSARSQAPLHCYFSLNTLAETMDPLYPVYEPRWAATLHAALYYLQRELDTSVHASDKANVAQSVNLSRDLIQFCQDVQLDRAVLAEHLRETAQPRRRNGRQVPSRVVDEDCSPSALVLVKHLTAIKTKQHGIDRHMAALTQLRARLQGSVQTCVEAQSHTASLSLENDVVGEHSAAKVAVLKELPLGSVSRAAAQCKMLLQALL